MGSRARRLRVVLAVAIAIAAVFCVPVSACAAETDGRVHAGNKGMVGLGFVGAELGLAIPALAGVDNAWILSTLSVAGAAGGAVAGHFAIDRPDHSELAVASLTIGIALVVPAVVLTAWSTAYDPSDDEGVQRVAAARAGPGLLRFASGSVMLGVPALRFSDASLAPEGQSALSLGGPRTTHLTLLSGVF